MRSIVRPQVLSTLLALCGVFIGIGAATASDWKMASGYPDNSYLTQNVREFLANVEKQIGGAIKVTLHNNQSLVKLPDIARAVARLFNDSRVSEWSDPWTRVWAACSWANLSIAPAKSLRS